MSHHDAAVYMTSSAGTPNVDYIAINQTINVTLMESAAGETCFSLSVLDDTVLEEPLECLLLRIQIPDDAPDMLGIAPDLLGIAPGNDSTLCCIVDDDSELVIIVHKVQPLPQFRCKCEHHSSAIYNKHANLLIGAGLAIGLVWSAMHSSYLRQLRRSYHSC